MSLRDTVQMNISGTNHVLELAKGINNIEVFVHVSTSYCHCDEDVLEEELYPSKHKPQHIMECCSWMDDEVLQYLQPKLTEPQPNTYAYTKSLTEDLVSQYTGKFPIAIARPSIVTAALNEPMPGWVDNLNGPTGLLLGAVKGVLRTMHLNEKMEPDLMPVDMAVNGCIIVAYTTDVEKPQDVQVYNLTQSGINSISWGQVLDFVRVHVQEFPFSVCLWYPGGSLKSSRVHHELAAFFTQLLPALLIDLLLILLGKKTFMIRLQKRIRRGMNVLHYFASNYWHFKNDNYLSLRKKLSKEDNDIFYTDMKIIDWNMYFRYYIKGIREYCCKEDPSTIPQAKILQRRLFHLDKAMQFIVYTAFAYVLYLLVNSYM